MELIPLLMFVAVGVTLLSGYPVAFCLGGVALMFAAGGLLGGAVSMADLTFLPGRLFGIIENTSLMAVPLFVFMGVMLEKSRVAERLLASMGRLLAVFPGGLGLAIVLVGALLAASTGIVGATVVTMGLLSLPTMLRHGYNPSLATGLICATGTLGQIIPPSIALVLLGDVLSTAYQEAQLSQGAWSLDTVSVGDLFVGALVPGLLLIGMYLLYVVVISMLRPEQAPAMKPEEATAADGLPENASLLGGLVAPLLLITAVLGSILGGLATPTEAAGVGAFGALLLAVFGRHLDRHILRETVRSTTRVTAMVFMILIGASLFSLVFRAFGGDETVEHLFDALPGGVLGATLVVMLIVFLLGFILDFMEITFVVVPIVGPVLLAMGVDPVWLGVMIALNLQTSFLTPPFGFALFYLRGVAPPEVRTSQIYKGVIPFILIQLTMLGILALFPGLATWLPELLYG